MPIPKDDQRKLLLRHDNASGSVGPPAVVRVVDKVVAQVSKPAVSQSFQPADAATLGTRLSCQRRADLEVGDTAGWKPALPGTARPLRVDSLLESIFSF
jgi:hypothetical protein